MILVGYEGDSPNYRVYDPTTKRVSVTRDATFYERVGRVKTDKEEKSGDEVTVFFNDNERKEEDGELQR